VFLVSCVIVPPIWRVGFVSLYNGFGVNSVFNMSVHHLLTFPPLSVVGILLTDSCLFCYFKCVDLDLWWKIISKLSAFPWTINWVTVFLVFKHKLIRLMKQYRSRLVEYSVDNGLSSRLPDFLVGIYCIFFRCKRT